MLGRRDPFLTVLALALSLSVLSWLLPVSATQTDVRLDNAERLRRGIAVLREDSGLDRVALEHSQEMARRRDVWHDPSTSNKVGPWTGYGENAGSGPDLDSVHEAFMASKEHRVNILEKYFKLIGAGVVERGGVVYVTEIFVTRPFKPLLRGRQPRRAPPLTRKPPESLQALGRLQGARHAVAMLLRLAKLY